MATSALEAYQAFGFNSSVKDGICNLDEERILYPVGRCDLVET
jgi:hypothetical protein